ncbi:hypothetical protein FHX15_004257 [Rhizobium sp. BK650]|nr:hypothetical protein [Rhizobium sp. BK650]
MALALGRRRTFLFHGNFGRNAFDIRLRPGSVDHFRLSLCRRRCRGSWLLLFSPLLVRRLNDDDIIVICCIQLVAIAVRIVTITKIVAVVALEALLHLRLCGGNDAVIVLGVLQVIFSNDAVAGALGVTRELSIFLSDVLRSAADFHIGAGAVIGPGQRVSAFAVKIVVIVISTAAIVIVVIATPSTALILLSWPHRSFT